MYVHTKRVLLGIWVIPILVLLIVAPMKIQNYALAQGYDIQDAYTLGMIPMFAIMFIGVAYVIGWGLELARKLPGGEDGKVSRNS
jgi:hypothetical protein